MTELHPSDDDSIDLLQLFQTLWDGKWKIISTIVLFVAGAYSYILMQPPPTFTATTEIKPITSLEAEKYQRSNAVGFFEILPSDLLNSYVEKLEERTFFEQQILDFALLDKNDYPTEEDYYDAVILFASDIKILPPQGGAQDENGIWRLQLQYNNEVKWMRVLRVVDYLATQSVEQNLQQRFDTALSISKQQRDFQLEDLKTKIENAHLDYEIQVTRDLAFLNEQSAIARTLGLAKNTIKTQLIDTQDGASSNLGAGSPYYLRGYEVIEKEIDLIKSRDDKTPFVRELLDLEQAKRSLEQDKTIERAELAFTTTPIMTSDDFKAVSLKIEATKFHYNSNRLLVLVLAACIGGFIAAIYVLMSSALYSYKARHDTSA